MDIQQLIESPPKLHHVWGDEYVHYGLHEAAVQFLVENVKPGMVTIETGGGFSTLLFALLGANHTCVMPDQGLIDRIKEFAAGNEIDLGRVRFICEPSERALPVLETEPIELALIDGRHGYPAPSIDWYYISNHLKAGAYVMIDDVHIWPCQILSDFLRAERDWTHIDSGSRGIAIYQLQSPIEHREFCYQPYVMQKTKWRKLRKRILLQLDKLVAGDFSGVSTFLNRKKKSNKKS